MELDIITMCDEPWGEDYKNEISFEKKQQKKKNKAVRYAAHSEQDEKGSTKTTE